MRRIEWSDRVVVIVSLAIAALGFAAGLLVVALAWAALKALGFTTSPWAMLEAVASAGAVALVLAASIIAYREVSEVRSSRHLEVADRLLAELNSTDNIEARRFVYQSLPDDPAEGIRTLTPEGQAAIKRVLNSLDRVAFLAQPGWIPENMVMPWMAIMITKTWTKVGPYVEYERKRRNEPDYYRYAEEVARRCFEWRRVHEPDAKITWVKNAL